ncbi:PC-esterase domain-containing protein 1B-like [Otolemur garnettii]|uniref:PC-esterase domain-containing protein 1B-like n=1 Tax=Otolemur garnettii TaxID=30611 RepID=UPI000273FE21|nr:PC-esterase domain-containing protein 1B-like [Otolemur garnettii]
MAHLRTHEVQQLLHNKFVVIMGDSIQRAVYKDLVLLLQKDCLLSSRQLKAEGERSFERDVLLEGGRRDRRRHGAHCREVRQFCSGHHLVRFYYLSRLYSNYVEDVLGELQAGQHIPDVLVMNSCLRDLYRYGSDFRRRYREHLHSLFQCLSRMLPNACLLVWTTAMPVAHTICRHFLPSEHRHRRSRLREDVLEANFYSAAEAYWYGFDVLDLHFHFRHAGHHRQRDGVHWDARAHRRLSQLLLTHVAGAWGVDLPRHDEHERGSIRDGLAGRHPGHADRRQPRAHRDDRALSSRRSAPRCHHESRHHHGLCHHCRHHCMTHHRHSCLHSDLSSRRQQFSRDTSGRRLGPSSTGSAPQGGRGSPLHSSRCPYGPHRCQRRCSDHRQGHRSHT